MLQKVACWKNLEGSQLKWTVGQVRRLRLGVTPVVETEAVSNWVEKCLPIQCSWTHKTIRKPLYSLHHSSVSLSNACKICKVLLLTMVWIHSFDFGGSRGCLSPCFVQNVVCNFFFFLYHNSSVFKILFKEIKNTTVIFTLPWPVSPILTFRKKQASLLVECPTFCIMIVSSWYHLNFPLSPVVSMDLKLVLEAWSVLG